MSDDHGYFWEKLHVAVLCLASGDAPLSRRLADAWVSALIRLNSADIPPQLKERYDALFAAVTRVEDPIRGTIEASVATMDEFELRDHAEAIVSMYNWVCHVRGPEHVLD